MAKSQPDLRTYIEQTLLKPEVDSAQIKILCEEAVQHEFFGVCVPPYFVGEAARYLQNESVKLVTVVGFPMGYQSSENKLTETIEVVRQGADEVDMVLNIAAFKSGYADYVLNDMKKIALHCHRFDVLLKVIIETALMTDEEIIRICALATEAKVDFVKTSTGFSKAGATVHHIELMRKHLPDHIRIKASGGIKEKKFALDLIYKGANRLGTSAGLKLIM